MERTLSISRSTNKYEKKNTVLKSEYMLKTQSHLIRRTLKEIDKNLQI